MNNSITKQISISANILYLDHFLVQSILQPLPSGIAVNIIFENQSYDNLAFTPNVEVWFPMQGYLRYYYNNINGLRVTRFMNPFFDLGDMQNNPPLMFIDYFIKPNENRVAYFFCQVPIEKTELMKEVVDRNGVLNMELLLSFSVMYNAGNKNSKYIKFSNIFNFTISKIDFENWMTLWSTQYALLEGLPKSVPLNVTNDYLEAAKCLNIGCNKASAVMSRRALQQAVEGKGATHGTLQKQIEELKTNKTLTGASKSLSDGIRQFGNYGAHPQDDLLNDITQDEAKLAFDVLKKILSELYN
jgi:hypothetical protein